jgi:hypothetical protein
MTESCPDCATKDKVIEELIRRIDELKDKSPANYQWWIYQYQLPIPYTYTNPRTAGTWTVPCSCQSAGGSGICNNVACPNQPKIT